MLADVSDDVRPTGTESNLADVETQLRQTVLPEPLQVNIDALRYATHSALVRLLNPSACQLIEYEINTEIAI